MCEKNLFSQKSLTATTNLCSLFSLSQKVLKSIINAFTSMKPNSDPPPWKKRASETRLFLPAELWTLFVRLSKNT